MQDTKLRELFSKIYDSEVIQDRIDEIQVVNTNTSNLELENDNDKTYVAAFTSSLYARSSLIGCMLSLFQ